jgi:ABC-2 type transport system permease protein
MKGFWHIYRKELYEMFMSPIFYVVAFIFLIISGVFARILLLQIAQASFQLAQHPELERQFSGAMELFLRFFLGELSVVLLFITPLLTMRTYAEERRSGTIELLYTYPVTDLATLTAKFAASMTVLTVLIAATLPGVIAVAIVSSASWKLILCGYVGLTLLGCSFIALGTFASTLTRNQIVSAMITFGGLMVLWFVDWAKNLVGPATGSVLDYLSVSKHFEGLSKGLVDSRDVLFFLVFSILFLFLTLRQMSSYRWRG